MIALTVTTKQQKVSKASNKVKEKKYRYNLTIPIKNET